MRQILHLQAHKLVEKEGLFPTIMTKREDMQSWIHSLHPVSCNKELIRLGPEKDGGYLVPDDLDGISACFSPGVSTVSGFEYDCAERGINVFLADQSVNQPTLKHERFHFTQKHIGSINAGDIMTMDNWVDLSLPESASDLLLQIDTEGCEYETFFNISDNLLNRFRVMVVEFHDLDMLWSKPVFDLVLPVFRKILQNHTCVHIHPNNCCGSIVKNDLEIPRMMEFTFLRQDRIKHLSYAGSFPHPMDRNNTSKPSLPLPRCWYQGKTPR